MFSLTLLLCTAARAKDAGRIVTLENISLHFDLSSTIAEGNFSARDTLRIFLDDSLLSRTSAPVLAQRGINLKVDEAGSHKLEITGSGKSVTLKIFSINGLLSIIPPIIAIIFALAFRQVVIALFAGVWIGSFILTGYRPISSLFDIISHYIPQTLAGPSEGIDHISIIIFTLLLGGVVGITSRMGGMRGIVNTVSKLATTARRGQFTVWLMGIMIFFDDYTNTLVVGNSMRPLTDKLRISREKLSYIVDSTAAPITCLAVITSWIGFQISLLGQAFNSIGIDRNPLTAFISSLPYSFYPILALLFVLFIIYTKRDYSLMYKAEMRARKTGKLSSETAQPASTLDSESVSMAENASPVFANGIIPIATVIAVSFAGLVLTGKASLAEAGVDSSSIFEAIKESNSFTALLWGSFSGCITAAVLALSQKLLTLNETIEALVNGIKSMMPAILILVLAWSIGEICSELHTADFLVNSLSEVISVRYLPMIVFVLAMGISFSTGTSWGTLSILTPIVIPMVFGTAKIAGLEGPEFNPILFSSIAAILSGAIFGDHCSPISDTTIMSSMASGADHVDHVKTQLPYALTVGATSLVTGYLLVALGVPITVSLIISACLLFFIIRIFGKQTD
ncbi:MAG: Na+/H+ antiporter NhaC family protein [Candidatus Krumholzibacteriota bacterium]|nr:Na+/H+ antiporter NhaC family protein [Candidatus Krumholzibacteriota bacterium]